MDDTIIIHAGMPKAGSSSVQEWLKGAAGRELADQDVTLVAARESTEGRRSIEFLPYDGDHLHSGWIMVRYAKSADAQQTLADEIASALARAVRRHGRIVVSSEGFARPFWQGDEIFLDRLDKLAQESAVHVAYYVRPQHTSLEAAWRQWGFRTTRRPAAYLADRSRQLHYAKTAAAVSALAPTASFEIRPFRQDLLDSGNVVVDFARRFLGMPDVAAAPDEHWANQGLPLDVANVLSVAPPGMFWSSAHDNGRLNRIKRLIEGVTPPQSDRAELAQMIIHRYAFDRFEPENATMITELGWPTSHFVPPPEDAADLPGLEALDELMEPRASEPELKLLFAAMETAMAAEAKAARLERRAKAADTRREQVHANLDKTTLSYNRLRNRRSVKLALRLSRIAAPLFRRRTHGQRAK